MPSVLPWLCGWRRAESRWNATGMDSQLDYRCHTPGASVGLIFEPNLRDCLSALARGAEDAHMFHSALGLVGPARQRAVRARAQLLLEHGLEGASQRALGAPLPPVCCSTTPEAPRCTTPSHAAGAAQPAAPPPALPPPADSSGAGGGALLPLHPRAFARAAGSHASVCSTCANASVTASRAERAAAIDGAARAALADAALSLPNELTVRFCGAVRTCWVAAPPAPRLPASPAPAPSAL